jgi:Leucine-rich repeat (LRR) protein
MMNKGLQGFARVVEVDGTGGKYDDKDGDEKRKKMKMMDDRDRKKKHDAHMNSLEIRDDRVKKIVTADEELEGRSIWSLVDRGTLAVGCFLILVVIIAVTIPVTLISNDEPYVQPPEPAQPTGSPTFARDLERYDIMERLLPIVPGGIEVLEDANSAHHRAFMWLVYEDGMELGAGRDNLHQRFVLMVIYFISGPWTPVDGRLEWGSPVHECEWEGIYCKDVEELEAELEGRIEELLEVGREDGIKIDVPQRIVNRLELRQRLVTGEVPSEFSLLYYLQHLDLENNQLVGALPVPLYKLFNLRTLFIEQNELTNVDAIGEYRHLEHLALSKNSFLGPMPESFSNLKKLKTLYLHTNAFTGPIFDILRDFTSMELLDIAFNEFTGTLPTELGLMTNLTSVFVGQNMFEGEIPIEIGECTNLKQFQIDGSPGITGTIPSVFGQLKDLEFLKLDTCSFGGPLPPSLGNLEKLTFLDVNSNELTGLLPATLGKAIGLKTLALANNNFGGNIPSDLGLLVSLGEYECRP